MSDSLYPEGPVDVPVDYVQPSKAYRRHAWLAVAGLVGFFLLYAAATTWFGYKAVSLGRAAYRSGSLPGWVGATLALFFFVFLAKALLPSKRTKAADRVEVTKEDQPALFEFVHRIADEANAPRPRKVFVCAEVNASVFYELNLSTLIFPSRKNLLIGLGLVNVLTLSEFKAVLAHEFGHFAQRAMAVGRWVYVGQQVAGRIIARRDVVDKFLEGISYIDIRVAWVGWILRLVAWAIRALTETFFRLVVVAELALSREMELQADRVSVSVAGSDALVHGLYRLRAADAAWSHVEGAAAKQLALGKRVPDLFALHSMALGELRRIFGADEFGDVPPLPEDPESHRIFTPQLAQPPVMWATHPPSHERELHAKQPYISAPSDERSAWCVFSNVEQLRRQVSARELESWGASAEAELLDVDASVATASEAFDKGFLEARYHGLYLGREVTRQAELVPGLYNEVSRDREAIEAVLADPYPETLGDLVRGYRDLQKEQSQLRALEVGVADAPGRTIQHRGETLKRKELRAAIERVEGEVRVTRTQLYEVDRRIRTAHWSAAAMLGEDWANLHSVHLGLLHFAEHVEANLDDAMGHLNNVFSVVTADGRITDSEVTRLLNSSVDVFGALLRVWESREAVTLGPAVAANLEVEDWAGAFDEEFGLLPPSRDNLQDWLTVVDSWFNAYSGLMGRLRVAALEVLLDVEGHVRRCWLEERDAGTAPVGPTIQASYPGFVDGRERELQRTLGWWDRFVTADGWGPGAVRLAAAGAIVGAATFGGVSGGIISTSVIIHNGLHREVIVQMGDERRRVAALSRAEIPLDLANPTIETRTTEGELIERFTPEVENNLIDHAYSIAAAVPLVEWTVVYGGDEAPEPSFLGAVRWRQADVKYVFKEPPNTVRSSRDAVSYQVLSAVDAPDAEGMYAAVGVLPPQQHQRVALTHARWDNLPIGAMWLAFAHSFPEAEREAEELLAKRRAGFSPPNVVLERLAQDFSEEGDSSVCDEHEQRWRAAPSDGDAAYLALRCRPEDAEAAHATIEALERSPRNAWLMAAAAFAHYRLGDLAESVALLGRARRAEPWMAEPWALFEARLMRYQAADEGAVDLTELEEASMQVRLLAAGERDEEGGSQATLRLHRGDLEGAVGAATTEGRRGVFVRLAATSDGAPSSWQEEAAALEPTDNMSLAEAIAGIVIAHRTGGDAEPYAAVVRDLLEADADTLLAFGDAQRLADELDALEAKRTVLRPEWRGHAAVLGLGTLGEEAPAHWRGDARRFLFAGERPYLAAGDP